MSYMVTSIGSQVDFKDDFVGAALQGAVAGQTENSGSGAIVVGQPGGVAGLVTGTTGGNRSQLTTGLNHRPSDGGVRFQTRVKPVGAGSAAAVALFVGLTDTVALEMPIEISGAAVTSNASDAVGFFYDTAATDEHWRMAGVADDIDTLAQDVLFNTERVTPAQDLWETFAVEVTADGLAILSYGREGDQLSAGLREVGRVQLAVTPTVALTPIVIVETRTTAAKTVHVDYFLVSSGRADGSPTP